MGHHHIHDPIRNRLDPFAELGGVASHKVADEERNVLAPVPQCRASDQKDVEPVVEVLTEGARLHRGGEIPMSRRDDPDADADRLRAAHPNELPFLQHPQQLDLKLERQIADLIEEERPALGQLEPPNFPNVRAGEHPAFVTEQLALDQATGDRAAIERDQRLVGSGALPVNRLGR